MRHAIRLAGAIACACLAAALGGLATPAAEGHPLLLGAPAPLNLTAGSGYYYDATGALWSHQCFLEVAADNPRIGDDRYTEFTGTFSCSAPTGRISVSHQAHLYDQYSGGYLTSGPKHTGNMAHTGFSTGTYTRVAGAQTLQIRYDITLTLPAYPKSEWSNPPPGCTGVNTRTATCQFWSIPFQAVPLAGDCEASSCPDRDGDGVYDDADACPDSPGDAGSHGCPPANGSTSDVDADGDYEEVGPAETDYEGAVAADEEVPDGDADVNHQGNYLVSCASNDEYVEGIAPAYGLEGAGTAASTTPEAALVSFASSGGLMPALPATLFVPAERSPSHVVYVARSEGAIRAVIVVERTGSTWFGVYYEGCSKFAQQVAAL